MWLGGPGGQSEKSIQVSVRAFGFYGGVHRELDQLDAPGAGSGRRTAILRNHECAYRDRIRSGDK